MEKIKKSNCCGSNVSTIVFCDRAHCNCKGSIFGHGQKYFHTCDHCKKECWFELVCAACMGDGYVEVYGGDDYDVIDKKPCACME